VISPEPSDPPAPTRICFARRGDGLCKAGLSEDAAAQAVRRSREIYHFAGPEAPRGLGAPRCWSQPPPTGLATGVQGHPHWGHGNPLTMEGKDTALSAMGHPPRPSPLRTFRSNQGNHSGTMSQAINHEVLDQLAAAEAERRAHTEPDFAARCAMARDSKAEGAPVFRTIRDLGASSAGLRSQLEWPEPRQAARWPARPLLHTARLTEAEGAPEFQTIKDFGTSSAGCRSQLEWPE